MLAIGLGMMQFCSEWLSFLGCCPCEAMPVAGFKIMKGQPTAYRELRSEHGHKSPLESHLGIPCHFLSVWAILLSCMNTAWTGERVYLELGKNVHSHNLHILSTQPLARAGIRESRQPSSPEGSLPATLAMKKHNTGQQLLKIQP